MDSEVRYTITIVDNISGTTETISSATKELANNAREAQEAIDSQRIAFIAQIAAVSAVYAGLNMVNTSMLELGLISEANAKSFRKLSASVGLVLGAFQLIRGSIEIVNSLKTSEIALAAVESYRAVLKNPSKMVAVTAGLGVAAGVGGYFMGLSAGGQTNQQNTNVQQSFTFSGQTGGDARSFARDTLEMMGG